MGWWELGEVATPSAVVHQPQQAHPHACLTLRSDVVGRFVWPSCLSSSPHALICQIYEPDHETQTEIAAWPWPFALMQHHHQHQHQRQRQHQRQHQHQRLNQWKHGSSAAACCQSAAAARLGLAVTSHADGARELSRPGHCRRHHCRYSLGERRYCCGEPVLHAAVHVQATRPAACEYFVHCAPWSATCE